MNKNKINYSPKPYLISNYRLYQFGNESFSLIKTLPSHNITVGYQIVYENSAQDLLLFHPSYTQNLPLSYFILLVAHYLTETGNITMIIIQYRLTFMIQRLVSIDIYILNS